MVGHYWLKTVHDYKLFTIVQWLSYKMCAVFVASTHIKEHYNGPEWDTIMAIIIQNWSWLWAVHHYWLIVVEEMCGPGVNVGASVGDQIS